MPTSTWTARSAAIPSHSFHPPEPTSSSTASFRSCASASPPATVYAVGRTQLRLYGDLKLGPGIALRQGFGIELAVGLPVVGTVSVTYVVGIEMELNNQLVEVGAFIMFKGRAEILGGIVTVTICIEARGSIARTTPLLTGDTTLEAQVTFGLDISIFLIINISFEESWKETRQIG